MGQAAVTGATVACTFGTVPSTLNVTSQTKVMIGGIPAGTIQDAQVMNLPPFGLCTSLANPQVAAATAAALGVLTPQPCMMMPAGAWLPVKPTVCIDGKPILTNDCKLMCAYGGCINIVSPGQVKTMV